MSLNKVMLIGNVGKTPEIRYIKGSQSSFDKAVKVASFTLATNEYYRDRNGEVKQTTEWHDIAAWGALADFVEKWVAKGATLYVEGRIRTKVWNDRDEKTHKVTEIIAGSIQLLDRKSVNAESMNAESKPSSSMTTPKEEGHSGHEPSAKVPDTAGDSSMYAPDDDLPF